jgi:hypothetical protein
MNAVKRTSHSDERSRERKSMHPSPHAARVAGVAAVLLGASAHAGALREWRFDVSLDGRPIGEHHYALRELDNGRELTSEARFRVKVLFFPAYRYEHEAREVWRGECLAQIDARTDDNGERSTVIGRESGGRFRVETGRSVDVLEPCVQSFAYWNPQILEAARLLNPQTGEHVPVTVVRQGRESIGNYEHADRYRLIGADASGAPLQIDLWYTREREWLALESLMPDGRRLRYSLK